VRNQRKDVNVFFKRAVEEEWIAKNPCAMVKPPKVFLKDKPPMPVRDIFELLRANREEPVVGRLALEIFGSLRCSSVARARPEWIDWEARGIRLPGANEEGDEQLHKSGRTLFRQGHPPVLWEWLKHGGDEMWEVTRYMYPQRKGQAFIRAKVKNPGNGLRRSCASYQLAMTKSVGPVSYLMQHKHQSTTQIYEGVAKESDARLFMAMTPEAVRLSWEEFCQSNQQPPHNPNP
jgi:integrase